MDEEQVRKAIRFIKRAGVPMEKTYLDKFDKELGKTDSKQRKSEAQDRKEWEAQRTSSTGSNVAKNVGGRSALSRRATTNGKPDLFMNNVLDPDSIATIAALPYCQTFYTP